MNSIILDINSKNFEVIEIKPFENWPTVHLIVFEGEKEYKTAAKVTDIIGGNIIQMFHDTESCFLRDMLFVLKRKNPKIMFFILRVKP